MCLKSYFKPKIPPSVGIQTCNPSIWKVEAVKSKTGSPGVGALFVSPDGGRAELRDHLGIQIFLELSFVFRFFCLFVSVVLGTESKACTAC